MNTINQLIEKVRLIDELESLADNKQRFYVEHDHTQALPASVADVIRKALKDEAQRLRDEFFNGLDCCGDCDNYLTAEICSNCRAHTGKGKCFFSHK